MTGKIAIAGTIVFDEIKQVERYPNKSELSTITNIQQSMGGLVANCAIGLAKIDCSLPIEAIALVGKDEKGKFLQAGLRKYKNINVAKVKELGETPFTDVIQDSVDKSRTFFTYKGNSANFDEDFIPLKELNTDILHVGYILLLDALDQPDECYGTKLAKVLSDAQKLGIKTSIDIVSENSDRYQSIVPPSLKYTNYCIINELEAGKSVGISLRDVNDCLIYNNIREVLIRLKDFGVQDWVIIHAPEGSFGFDGKHFYNVPSIKIDETEIKGTVGAGDAFTSGVLYGALKGYCLSTSMELGTSAAATSLFARDSTSGIRSHEELREFYEQREKNKTEEI